jgi:hypothetical protein
VAVVESDGEVLSHEYVCPADEGPSIMECGVDTTKSYDDGPSITDVAAEGTLSGR